MRSAFINWKFGQLHYRLTHTHTKFTRPASKAMNSSHKFQVVPLRVFTVCFSAFPFSPPSPPPWRPTRPNVVFLLSPTTQTSAMAMTSQSVARLVGNGAIEFQPSRCAKTSHSQSISCSRDDWYISTLSVLETFEPRFQEPILTSDADLKRAKLLICLSKISCVPAIAMRPPSAPATDK